MKNLLTVATVMVATAAAAQDSSLDTVINFNRLGYITATSVFCYDLGYDMADRKIHAVVVEGEDRFIESLMPLQHGWFSDGVVNADSNRTALGVEEFCHQAELSGLLVQR